MQNYEIFTSEMQQFYKMQSNIGINVSLLFTLKHDQPVIFRENIVHNVPLHLSITKHFQGSSIFPSQSLNIL